MTRSAMPRPNRWTRATSPPETPAREVALAWLSCDDQLRTFDSKSRGTHEIAHAGFDSFGGGSRLWFDVNQLRQEQQQVSWDMPPLARRVHL